MISNFLNSIFLGRTSRPTTQSGNSSAIKESADSNSATIDDANDTERTDRLSKKKKTKIRFDIFFFL